jgi:3-methyladenine DNA glycosylase AlkD
VTSERARAVLAALEAMADPARLDGMRRYGIATDRAIGVGVTDLRRFARSIGRDHRLAGELWRSGIHEARMLATIVDEPALVTPAQMDAWVRAFDSWDLCDGACGNLFDRTPYWFDKAVEWSAREPEFERRAGFALMAWSAVHRTDQPDRRFERFFPLIRRRATDDRNYVKKAVSWALRQIGKRGPELNAQAIRTARRIATIDDPAARWIARDALRELESPKVQERVRGRAARVGAS